MTEIAESVQTEKPRELVPMVHLVRREWRNGPPTDVTLCGADRATIDVAEGTPVDCVVCNEIANSELLGMLR